MGERDRNQSSYDYRNDGEHHDESSHRDQGQQGQRAQRDWNNDEVRRSQGRDHNDHNDRNSGQSYGQNQDRNYGQNYGQNQNYGQTQNYGQDRQFGQNYGQDRHYGQNQHYGQDRQFGQSYGQDRNYGSFGARFQDDRDASQRYNSGGYDARRYPSYSAFDNRYERDAHGVGRSYQQEQHLGAWYGQELYRPAQEGSLHRDWNARGEHEARGPQHRDDDSFGQQLRDGANRVARKVKRAFRGPKGYKRSDERIREDVSDRLAEQNQVDPSEIEVAVANGDVTLTGTVNSRHEKFLAEEIADEVSGVNDVQNQLRVRREQQSQGAGSHSGETASTTANQNSTEAQRRNARA